MDHRVDRAQLPPAARRELVARHAGANAAALALWARLLLDRLLQRLYARRLGRRAPQGPQRPPHPGHV
eukprot:6175516-Pleurochrysis_carterae.AAC.4